MTAPDMRGRLRAIRERGGKVVVVDPRRTRTAERPTSTTSSVPAATRMLLAAIAQTLLDRGPRPTRPRSSAI